MVAAEQVGAGVQHLPPPGPLEAAGQVDVEEHDVRAGGVDDGDRGRHVRGLADDLDRGLGGELGADAAAEHAVVVDEDDPDRGAHVVASAGPAGISSSDLRALARGAADGGAAAVPLHARHDRLPDAEAVGGHGVRVEPGPAVAHEGLHAVRARLHVDLHRGRRRRLPVLDGVDHGLAQRGDEGGGPVVRGAVADDDDLDGGAVPVLDLRRGGLQLGGDAPGVHRIAAVEPRPQVTLLGAGEPGDLHGVVAAALDQGEGLQHGVVQVRGDLRPLRLAGAGRALGVQIAPEPDPPRREDDGGAGQDGDGGDEHAPGGGEVALDDDEHDADEHEHQARDDAEDAPPGCFLRRSWPTATARPRRAGCTRARRRRAPRAAGARSTARCRSRSVRPAGRRRRAGAGRR